ncbi:MAG: polyprenyl synthetase family protein [Rikenellaceae bacterium]|nr:polyprenyl synthetase family protein [Rikenellaceae bacterium]
MRTLEELAEITERSIIGLTFPDEPRKLFSPVKYTLEAGGKRIRPLLALAACNMFNDNAIEAIDIALGIEVFHNFTLLHDDIMDNAGLRRGRPTVHKKWDENTAILSGDAMVIYSYELISRCKPAILGQILKIFNSVALGVCQGQQYDMDFETSGTVSIPEYMEMIRLKTAVLLAGAAQMGALAGGASYENSQKMYDFGIVLGLGFQLQDDVLDTYGDPETFGKNIGGDIESNKKTFLMLKALETAGEDDKKKLLSLIECKDIDKTEKFNAVKEIYDRCNVKESTGTEIEKLHNKAVGILNGIDLPDDRKNTIREIIEVLIKRDK